MNTSSPGQSLGFLVSDLARLMRRDFDQRVAGLGLTQAQWRALAQLTRAEGCRQADLAAVMEIAPITLARFVDRLEEAGLVERRRHPADRRAVQLYLTAKGRRTVEKMRVIASQTYDHALQGIPAAERKRLAGLLQRMRDNLSGPGEAGATEGDRHGR
jgi:DNA-binding MarR family transcriptional regulator